MTRELVVTRYLVKARHQDAQNAPCEPELVAFSTDFGRRFDELRAWFGWTWREMSRECGFRSESHAKLIADTGSCRVDQLLKVHERTRVNLNWLVAGEGTSGIALTPEGATSLEIARRTKGHKGKRRTASVRSVRVSGR